MFILIFFVILHSKVHLSGRDVLYIPHSKYVE